MKWAAENATENRSEGCTSAVMNLAAKNGHNDMVKWLHLNRREGCTTEAMESQPNTDTLKLSNGCKRIARREPERGLVLFLNAHRTECFESKRCFNIKLSLDVTQWMITNYSDNLRNYEFEVARCDWRYLNWCRNINLQMIA
ncbi:uncharacterized protein CCR75_001930 [Bremia lactucae]|uniref:Uncharacterized protein n=1 Tax=Bremia lactucae TaxID=4779 RepID=A0A976FRR2_BRELC|nr:hypothetical protein CCR75_001930 [Bremia lactucae]